MRRAVLYGLVLALVAPFLSVSSVHAAPDTKNRGLLITPLRNYLSVDAGDTLTRAYTVANLTDKPMTVTADVEKFSVVDLSYDFKFDTVSNDYVQLVQKQLVLKPYESKEIPYRIVVPKGAAAGGQYFTLLASAKLTQDSVQETVRAASLLYLTVNGPLDRSGIITKSSLPSVVFTPTIPYRMTIRNTGNIHYFAYISARVDGLFYQNAPTGTSVLLMPETSREVSASVPSPLMPGIYKVTYGYKPDAGTAVSKIGYILFLPPWFIVALIIVGFSIYGVLNKRRVRARPTDS